MRSAAEGPAPRSPAQLTLTGHAIEVAAPPPPRAATAGPHTSLTDPLAVRWLDLSIAGARAPRGRIGLCAAPGRRDGQAWQRTLSVDLDRLVALHQVDHLVLLLDEVERAALGLSALVAEAEARGVVVTPLPLAPGSAPAPAAARPVVDGLLAVARAGRRIVLVGRDGEERPGTVAALALIELGLQPDAAVRAVRAVAGPRAVGPGAQRLLVDSWPPTAGA